MLEASAGTGKTSVLVARYLNLLSLDVDPSNILAITFTRKAAAEMRERIVTALRRGIGGKSRRTDAAWLALQDRLNDVSISTIDAFCLRRCCASFRSKRDSIRRSRWRMKPRSPRLVEEALDHAIRICRKIASDRSRRRARCSRGWVTGRGCAPGLRAPVGAAAWCAQAALEALSRERDRAISRSRSRTADAPPIACATRCEACRQASARTALTSTAFLADGPVHHAQFAMLAVDVGGFAPTLELGERDRAGAVRGHLVDRLRSVFPDAGRPPPADAKLTGTGFEVDDSRRRRAWRRHCDAVKAPSRQR